MSADLVNLPWQTLLTLACGYAAYFVANTGVRDHHKPIDVAFSSLVFGFFSVFVYETAIRAWSWNILPSSAMAFGAALLLGAIWRKWGRSFLKTILRASDVSHADDVPSAWAALFDVTCHHGTQLSVQLKNGTWLQCDDLDRFSAAPNGPCVFGGSGDILLYVTDIREPGKESEANSSVEFEGWGQEITYIPASEIARVDFRRKPTS